MASPLAAFALSRAPTLRRVPALARHARMCARAAAPELPDAPVAAGRRLRKGDVVRVRVEALAYGGAGVARLLPVGAEEEELREEDAALPVYTPKGAVPGDVVSVKVKRVRRRPPQERVSVRQSVGDLDRDAGGKAYVEGLFVGREGGGEALCKHFGNAHLGGGGCGGCATIGLEYARQLAEKQRQVEGLFERVSGEVGEIVGCERVFGYRNKMEFSYGRKWYVDGPPPGHKKGKVNYSDAVGAAGTAGGVRSGGVEYALGMHAPGRYDRIVEIEECHIQHPIGNEILVLVRKRCADMGFEPYDPVDQSGLVRNVMLRSAESASGELELMVNIQTGPCEVPQRLVPLAEELRAAFPAVVCVVQNMPSSAANVAMDPRLQRLLSGPRAYIEQRLGGLTYEISANSFFQTNPHQAETLYDHARRVARLGADDVVLDLFCGTGTIGLSMARDCGRVVGVEIVADAVEDARRNASRNGIKNAQFIQGNLDRAKDLPVGAISGENAADVIILDPPRAGISPKLGKELARTTARRIVYISCNPASCARDVEYLQQLASGRFVVEDIQPVDMFPHTPHIEVVVGIAVVGEPPEKLREEGSDEE